MNDGNDPGSSPSGRPRRRGWLIVGLLALLALDYATLLRIEIFDEVTQGKSFLDAVVDGNPYLTALGIGISVVVVAWILYLLTGRARR